MRTSLSLGTRGKLSKNIKRALIISSFGLIALTSTPKISPSTIPYAGHNYTKEQNVDINLQRIEQLKKEDEELLLLINITLNYT